MRRRLAIFIMFGVLVVAGSAGCTSGQNATQQFVKVSRGDLTLTVSGSGNLSIANEAKLYFAIPGRITELNVKEGGQVAKGDVVARLDDAQLQLALAQASVGLSQAKANVIQTKVAVAQALTNVSVAELALNKALETYKWPEIEVAQKNVDQAKLLLQYNIDNMSIATTPAEAQRWAMAVANATANLAIVEAKLKAQTIGSDPEEIKVKRAQLDLANQSVDAANQSVELANESVELSGLMLAQAEKNIKDTVLTAPFDGVVTRVGPSVGDTVSTVTVIANVVDLTSLELKAAVDEVDIPSVKTGQLAAIALDAMPERELPAKVTAISNTSSVQSGIVSYSVTIRFDNPGEITLRSGMSATADIAVLEKKDVLLVPSRAIEQGSGGKSTVKVQVGTLIEERTVTTGADDGINTEIIDGLSEGDTVVVTVRSSGSDSLLGG